MFHEHRPQAHTKFGTSSEYDMTLTLSHIIHVHRFSILPWLPSIPQELAPDILRPPRTVQTATVQLVGGDRRLRQRSDVAIFGQAWLGAGEEGRGG